MPSLCLCIWFNENKYMCIYIWVIAPTSMTPVICHCAVVRLTPVQNGQASGYEWAHGRF